MCAVITWLCMILIFHPKHNNSAESNPAEDEVYTEDSNKINNNSGISSTNTYAHAPTLVYGSSQASSEYMYKSCHPLTKSSTINSSNCESAFQYGPLPIVPSSSEATTTTTGAFRKNNSIASTAPSMTTLVSHHQVNHGSNGKSNSMYPRSTKGSISASSDYFQVAMPDEKTLPSPDDYYDSRASYNNAASIAAAAAASRHYQQQQELEINDLKVKHIHASLNKQEIPEEYVPPPLSPARKSRGDVIQSLRPEQDRKRYTHSMMIIPCDEDMGEFGITKNDARIYNNDNDLVPGRSPHEGQGEELPTTSNHIANNFQSFQQQQTLNNSMLTSFKEVGSATTLLNNDTPKKFMNHSTSSLLLPLPFETSNYSISSSFNEATEEHQKRQQPSSSTSSSSSSSSSTSSSNDTNLMHDTNVFNL